MVDLFVILKVAAAVLSLISLGFVILTVGGRASPGKYFAISFMAFVTSGLCIAGNLLAPVEYPSFMGWLAGALWGFSGALNFCAAISSLNRR